MLVSTLLWAYEDLLLFLDSVTIFPPKRGCGSAPSRWWTIDLFQANTKGRSSAWRRFILTTELGLIFKLGNTITSREDHLGACGGKRSRPLLMNLRMFVTSFLVAKHLFPELCLLDEEKG